MPVAPEGELVEARFLERPNRFVVRARAGGRLLDAHCPNPGRLEEFLHEGNPFLLRRRPDASPQQATTHSVFAALDPRFHVGTELEHGQAPPAEQRSFDEGSWVYLDTQMANRIVADALARGALDNVLGPVESFRTEPRVDGGRFDLAIDHGEGPEGLVEIKSVTLIAGDGHTGLFPDAPTERGTRHLRELAELAEDGVPTTIFFLAMREDAEAIEPNTERDPAFARALEDATDAGVSVQAARIRSQQGALDVGDQVPVDL